MRFRGVTHALAAIAAASASFACGPTEGTGTSSNPSPPGSRIAATTAAGSAQLPQAVALGKLPPEGVAISVGEDVVLVSLNGKVLSELEGFSIAGNPGANGVWLERGKNYVRLDTAKGELTPISRRLARTKIYDEGPEPNLPPPNDANVNGRVVGRWRYAYQAGGQTLAQWSGECEIPTAFWVQGSSLRIVTGEPRLSGAPESIALGWSSSGDAVILVGAGACGSASNRPGIYIFSAPGDGTLIYETKGFASADMW